MGILTCPIQNGDDGGLLIKAKNLRQLIFELCHQKWVKIGIIPLIRYTSTAIDEKTTCLNPKSDISKFPESASLLLLWRSSKDGWPLCAPGVRVGRLSLLLGDSLDPNGSVFGWAIQLFHIY